MLGRYFSDMHKLYGSKRSGSPPAGGEGDDDAKDPGIMSGSDSGSDSGSEIAAGSDDSIKAQARGRHPLAVRVGRVRGDTDNTGGYYSVDKSDGHVSNFRVARAGARGGDDDDDEGSDLSARCDAEARMRKVIKDPRKRQLRRSRLIKQLERLLAKIANETGASSIAFTAPVEEDCRRKGTMITVTSPDVCRRGLFVEDALREELVKALQRLRPSYTPNQEMGRMRVFIHHDDPVHTTTVNVNMEMLQMVRRIGNQCGTIIHRVKKQQSGVTADSRANQADAPDS